MLKEELKQILHRQHEPFAISVEKKMADLIAGNLPNYYPEAPSADESLQDAYENNLASSAYNAENNIENAAEEFEPKPEPHKMSTAAKIAALRGIAFVGDYLPPKS